MAKLSDASKSSENGGGDCLQNLTHQGTFYLESYTIPNELEMFLQVLDDETDSEHPLNTEFYWYFTKGKYKGEFEKATESKIAPEFLLTKRELFPCYVHRCPTNTMVIYGMNCVIKFYILITSLNPLNIKIFKNGFVKFIQPPYFKDSTNSTKARMMYDDLVKLLKQKKYKESWIDNLWDSCCQRIILSMFSILDQANTKLIDHKFFHLLSIDFIIDERLEPFICNINSDPELVNKNTVFDKPKRDMVEDILKNVCLKVIKNMPERQFKELKIKQSNIQTFKNITSGIRSGSMSQRYQRWVNCYS